MKKRKKKPSRIQQQKLHLAHHKNEYHQRLCVLLCKLGLSHLIKLLTPHDWDELYLTRIQSIRILPAEGCIVPEPVFELARDVVSAVHKQTMISISPDDQLQISLYDYLTLLLGFIVRFHPDKPPANEKDQVIKEALKQMRCIEIADKNATSSLYGSMKFLNVYSSDLRHLLFYHYQRVITEHKGKLGMMAICEVHCIAPEKKNFVIDGLSRPAIRVGWGIEQPGVAFDFVRLTPEQLNINFRSKGLKMPVYIQSHAIQRLSERLDSCMMGMTFWFLYKSLTEHVAVQRDRHGNILITLILGFHKVGYLVADIVDSSVVIRTFLFLTQAGTPEGEKLGAITGMDKLDKSYLEIDKLSTFMQSDIHDNEKLKNLFIEAGCGSFFLLEPSVFTDPEHTADTPKADKILQYLGLNRKEDEVEDFEGYETEKDPESKGEKEKGCD